MVNVQLDVPTSDNAAASTATPSRGVSLRSAAMVITTSNRARYLADAIESCREQTHALAEIIVVDDGSTDDPESVVAQYKEVRLVCGKTRGRAAARNLGAAEARSEFVLFLDADDRLLPKAVEASIACFASHPDAGFVYGGYRPVGAANTPIGKDRHHPVGAEAYLELLKGHIAMVPTALYDRRKFVEVGGFDVSLQGVEDYELHLRLGQRHPVVSHSTTVTECRMPTKSGSIESAGTLESILKVLDQQECFAAADPKVAAALAEGRRSWRQQHATQPEGISAESAQADASRARIDLAGMAKNTVRHIGRRLRGRDTGPLVARVDFGDFERVRPISADFGYDRGTPVDRFYVERFLEAQSALIKGRVLEVGDDTYSQQFGGSRITKQDVLHVSADNPAATIVGDLADVDLLPDNAFDCLVLTQTLHLVYDMPAAVRSMHRALKPGGVALVTVPGLSPIDRGEWRHTWYWFLTRFSAARLFEEVFGAKNVEVETCGNAHVATAFIQGVALEEIDPAKLDPVDDSLAIVITVVARKSV